MNSSTTRTVRRFELAILGLALISITGTVGYVVVEDMSWVNALYMTIITLSTVGFAEVQPLTQAGRLFTVLLITAGVGSVLYLASVIAQVVIEGSISRMMGASAMTRRVDELRNHVIVCGFGRFGRIVVDEMMRSRVAVVIVERDPDKEAELEQLGAPFLIGSATSDDVLDRAHIEFARAIVAGTASDADNLFMTLSAREKNPDIRIHARGEGEAASRRLRLAGADQVISPYQSGGLQIATSILRPAVVDFLEISRPLGGEEVDLEELRVEEGSELAGQTIATLEGGSTKLRIVALRRGTARIELVPGPDVETQEGDHLVLIGDRDTLQELAKRASGPR
ncbi:MAG: potassium channel protein [Deltaproteobacteria bacterium]|nr:potassium channel protein [Deltaproteobacteria bacterium]